MTNPYYWSAHWRALRRECLERDRYTCTVDGCHARGTVVDHIETRPNVPHPCHADRLGNLRALCDHHDAQVKERGGRRKQGGKFLLKGCDASGWPIDPQHGGTG